MLILQTWTGQDLPTDFEAVLHLSDMGSKAGARALLLGFTNWIAAASFSMTTLLRSLATKAWSGVGFWCFASSATTTSSAAWSAASSSCSCWQHLRLSSWMLPPYHCLCQSSLSLSSSCSLIPLHLSFSHSFFLSLSCNCCHSFYLSQFSHSHSHSLYRHSALHNLFSDSWYQQLHPLLRSHLQHSNSCSFSCSRSCSFFWSPCLPQSAETTSWSTPTCLCSVAVLLSFLTLAQKEKSWSKMCIPKYNCISTVKQVDILKANRGHKNTLAITISQRAEERCCVKVNHIWATSASSGTKKSWEISILLLFDPSPIDAILTAGSKTVGKGGGSSSGLLLALQIYRNNKSWQYCYGNPMVQHGKLYLCQTVISLHIKSQKDQEVGGSLATTLTWCSLMHAW